MEHTSTSAFLLVLTAPASAKQSVEEATEGKKLKNDILPLSSPFSLRWLQFQRCALRCPFAHEATQDTSHTNFFFGIFVINCPTFGFYTIPSLLYIGL
jgi:hypothetical protein